MVDARAPIVFVTKRDHKYYISDYYLWFAFFKYSFEKLLCCTLENIRDHFRICTRIADIEIQRFD